MRDFLNHGLVIKRNLNGDNNKQEHLAEHQLHID